MRSQPDDRVKKPSLAIPQDLTQCGFIDALTADPRPTYVVDLHDASRHGRPVFWNAALENIPELYNSVTNGSIENTSSRVQRTSFTIKDRWSVTSVNQLVLNVPPASSTPHQDNHSIDDIATISVNTAPHNVQMRQHRPRPTIKRGASAVPEPLSPPAKVNSISPGVRRPSVLAASRIRGNSTFVEYFRTFDWASTELGDIETWPQQLVEMCNLMLANPDPTGIYWGPKAIVLYNEPIITTIGGRHPDALGRHMENVFPEVWEGSFKPLFEGILEQREPWCQYNDRRIGYNNGRLEEVFWNVTLVPILDEDRVAGTWGTLHDITTQNFWQRRIATLLRLTASMNASESFDAMWSSLINGFEVGDRDVPRLLVYTVAESLTATTGPLLSTVYSLNVSVGYETMGSPYHEFDITDDKHPLASLFRQTLDANVPMYFNRHDVDLSAEFWDAFQITDPDSICQSIVVIPICPIEAKDALAYLVIGVNPYVSYDKDYREFIDLARRQVSSTMASILLREDEVRRERLVAEEITAQLGILRAQAEEHEMRFKRLAETAPIGICTYSGDGSLTYANDVYRHIFGMGPDDDASGEDWWAHLVHPQDLIMAKGMFGKLLMERSPVTFEIRVKASADYKGTPGPEGWIWLLVSGYAEPTGMGPQTVIACFTDINERKRAEDNQSQRLEDVLTAKRQQEAFIDMTSHEIRNPLSVVLHCSEEIISTCTTLRAGPQTEEQAVVSVGQDVLGNVLDAAETIVFCTLHQKRIVDDILTLSKLESDLLPITPDAVQPRTLIDGIMKLFEREIRKCDMRMEIEIHPSFYEYHLEQVLLDPNRVSQIIINLISNAIKFTKTQDDRRLDVILGGALNDDLPSADWPVSYIERQLPPRPDVLSGYWNIKDSAHLHFAVIDTGAGMSEEEQQKIFTRFTQASPRTHVKYGGSGLGLFICRALSETHGGQIGCKSVSGKGSAFGFHVEVGRNQSQQAQAIKNSLSRPVPGSRVTSSTDFKSVPDNSAVISASPVITAMSALRDEAPKLPAFHVMIVEDNILNQRVLRRQLEKAGHTVVVAHHGQDALDQLTKTLSWVPSTDKEPAFDFILMDVEMPVMNGLVCTQRIREYEQQGLLLGHVPIIATTGNARDEHTGLALSAGMDQVVLKPYSLSGLLPIAQKLREQYGRKN